MKKFIYGLMMLSLCSCAQDIYRLQIDNSMSDAHGHSIYFRSNLRSTYASQIRRVLSNKFSESGMKTATSATDADFIGIFDIETFYKQTSGYKNTSYTNTQGDSALFTADEDSASLAYTGNANMIVDADKTCFTLNMGRKDTSKILYNSTFCASGVQEPENILPQILDTYGQYANYQSANVTLQCLGQEDNVSCKVVREQKQIFFNSLNDKLKRIYN
ncbi:MAG: hypothetical protein IJ525_06550 [Alphaproteobacteria bacterium]|nr:hypothetical protein [Alphaproteobacteria bacterium]